MFHFHRLTALPLQVKLTKKSSVPCLTFEVELPGLQGSRTCVHDIPVSVTLSSYCYFFLLLLLLPNPCSCPCSCSLLIQVLGRTVWKDYQEPALPPFDVSICLPDIKKLRHLTERYKVCKTPTQTPAFITLSHSRYSAKQSA